jgi:Beta-galactosidase
MMCEPSSPLPLREGPGEGAVRKRAKSRRTTTPSRNGRGILAVALLLCSAAVAHAAWPDYQIMEWQPRNAQQLATLKSIGVTGGMVMINRDAGTFDPASPVPAALRSQGMRYYLENTATDFYAAYHRYTPGKLPNWRFTELQARYAANPSDLSVFVRDPGLSDPVWLKRIEDRLTTVVDAAKADHPIYYSLGDETGIADLAANWDFDIAPASLTGFRAWLQTQYPSLAALNAEWGTHYATWDEVAPELTTAAMRRSGDNFAAWSDFKAWMDVAYARALRVGTDAVHRADPTALAAIEGAQVPGWGGYDYTLLAHAVDVIEIYDTYENLAILRSLNPDVVTLTTAFSTKPRQLHMIWREWLRGCRGLVLWDDHNGIVRPDGTPGPDAKGYAAVFAALRGPLGRAVLDSRPVYDPVAILYSPASFRVAWMLEHRAGGAAWATRTAAEEDTGDAQREALAADGQALEHLGLTPRYVGPDQLARGELGGAKALILPSAIALSAADATAVGRFVAHGGRVIADVVPGSFDEHGRRLARASLADLFEGGEGRIVPAGDQGALAEALGGAGVKPVFAALASGNDVTTYVYRDGTRTIVALQRDFTDSTAPEEIGVTLPRTYVVKDLRSGTSLGRIQRLELKLDPVTPAVLSLSEVPG